MAKRVFNWSLKKLCEMIDRVIENDFDFNIVITGNRGLGKSTLAYIIAKKTKFSKFIPNHSLLYSNEDIIKALSKRQKSKIIGDEIIQTAFNRDFYSKWNKLLIRTLTMYRDSHNLFIACAPNFASLDNQFRTLLRMRIDVVKRGIAVIHTPNQTQYSKDVWDTQVNEKIERQWVMQGTAKPKYSRLTTFRGVLKFPDLSDKEKEKYQKIKFEKRNKIFEEEFEKEGQTKNEPYDKLEELLVSGQVKNRKHFDELCFLFNLKPTATERQLKKRFRDKGMEKNTPVKHFTEGKTTKKTFDFSEYLKDKNIKF